MSKISLIYRMILDQGLFDNVGDFEDQLGKFFDSKGGVVSVAEVSDSDPYRVLVLSLIHI